MLKTLAFVATTLTATTVVAQTAYDEFPLDRGNLSVFVEDSTGYLAEPTQMNLVEVTAGGYYGRGWFRHTISGLYMSDVELWDHYWGNQMWTYSDSWYTAYDFDAADGDTFRYRIGPCEIYDVTYRTQGSVSTPAGTFGTIRDHRLSGQVDPNVRCMIPPKSQIVTSPGVGVVSYVDGNRKGHLMYAEVAGTVVASGPSSVNRSGNIEVTMVLTDDTLSHSTFNCLTQPCVNPSPAHVQVAFVVKNTGSQDELLFFTSGQTFEIDILDANGRVVRRWSEGRFFTQATRQVPLAAGQTYVYYGVVPATLFANGSELRGQFTAVGYLKASNSPKNDVAISVR